MTVTKRKLWFSFQLFKLCDILNIYPVTFHHRSAKISQEKSTLTTVIYGILFGISSMKLCHLVYTLTRKFVSNHESHLGGTILAGLWGSLCLTGTFWSYELFHRGLSETIILFNSLDFARRGGHDTVKKVGLAKVMQKMRSISFRWLVKQFMAMGLQELLLLACPYAVIMFIPITIGILALFPHWPLFSTSLLQPGTWLYGCSIGMEIITIVFMVMSINFLFFFELALQTIHMKDVDELLANRGVIGFEGKKYSLQNVDKCIESFDYYHVIVSLCNVLFSRVLFTGKLNALSCSIFGTYFVLKHMNSASMILLLFFGALSVNGISFYIISCKKLFEVPGGMKAMKNLCSKLLDNEKGKLPPWFFKVRKYKIKAMPSLGISDGGFRLMDSISTLVFIDFYLCQVISLLLL